jgi:hypothetical protein
MNKLITKFGHIVGQNVEDKPQKAFSLLKAAYMLSGWQIKFMPNKKLLPSEKYMALLCNQAIQQPRVFDSCINTEILRSLENRAFFITFLANFM